MDLNNGFVQYSNSQKQSDGPMVCNSYHDQKSGLFFLLFICHFDYLGTIGMCGTMEVLTMVTIQPWSLAMM